MLHAVKRTASGSVQWTVRGCPATALRKLVPTAPLLTKPAALGAHAAERMGARQRDNVLVVQALTNQYETGVD